MAVFQAEASAPTRLGIALMLGFSILSCAAAAIGVSDRTPPAADGPIVLRDSAQHELRLEHAPQRIVTLLPSLTETVCALGDCSRLVATDRFSNWPASVMDLPKAGGLDDAEIELIVSLKPDVVILAHAARVTDRLRDLGIATFVAETRNFADISRTVAAVGGVLGVPERAQILNRDIDRAVNEAVAAALIHLHGRSPLVYYEVDSGPYAAGPQSFIGELLARLGARNIVGSELGPFPKLNPEYVVRHNPDVILLSTKEANTVGNRPGWERIRAVQEQRICSFDPQVSDTIVRPGPRVAEGLRAIADCLTRVAP
jgi:iron complex transport system substrate-binding protein